SRRRHTRFSRDWSSDVCSSDLEDLEALAADLRRSGVEASGTLRLTTSASFGRQYLSPLLPEFLGRHPRVRLSVSLDDRVQDLVEIGRASCRERGERSVVAAP